MVQLINGLDFVFLCVAVWLCTIEIQSLKQRTKEKIAPQRLFTAFLSNFKGRKNSIQSTTVCFVFYEDDEIISWFSKTKYIKAHEEEYLGHFVFVDV